MVSTGIALEIPNGNFGTIVPRSGPADENQIDIGARKIDSKFRGELKVQVFNLSNHDFEVKAGDSIA